MCGYCENVYCGDCLKQWLKQNEYCPNKCPKKSDTVKEVCKLFARVLNGIKLKCKYGCEVKLLDYKKHFNKCETDNKQIMCFNCGKLSKYCDVIIKSEDEVMQIRQEIEFYKSEAKDKTEDAENALRDIIKLKECKEQQIKITEEELTKIKMEISELNKDHLNLRNSIEKLATKQGIGELGYRNEFYFPIETRVHAYLTNPMNSDFKISNFNKTIKKISGIDHWYGFFCKDKIGSNGIFEFSVKIDNINEYPSIMIGFSVGGTNNLKGLYANDSSWMCCLHGGRFYNAGNENDYFCSRNMIVRPSVDDIVSICINTRTWVIYVKVNGKVIPTEIKMNIGEGMKGNIYPCVDLARVGDQITLI